MRSASEKLVTQALVAAYTAKSGIGKMLASELTLITAARSRPIIPGTKACVRCTKASMFTRSIACNFSQSAV